MVFFQRCGCEGYGDMYKASISPHIQGMKDTSSRDGIFDLTFRISLSYCWRSRSISRYPDKIHWSICTTR